MEISRESQIKELRADLMEKYQIRLKRAEQGIRISKYIGGGIALAGVCLMFDSIIKDSHSISLEYITGMFATLGGGLKCLIPSYSNWLKAYESIEKLRDHTY